MPARGGEPRKLTDLPLGVAVPASRTGLAADRLRRTHSRTRPVRHPVEPGGDAPKPEAEAPRLITRLDYRADDVGFISDRHYRLFVVDAESDDEAVELTDGRCDVREPRWTPDGAHVVVCAPRDLGARETQHSDICAIPARGGEAVLLAHCLGSARAAGRCGGRHVLFVGGAFERYQDEPRNSGLFALPLDLTAPGTPRRLTDEETVAIDATTHIPVLWNGSAFWSRSAIAARRRWSRCRWTARMSRSPTCGCWPARTAW